jgi:GT2 family glycosyltransferase
VLPSNRLADLTVVLVSWNTRDLLHKCIRSVVREIGTLREQHYSAEIIVVDNASSDDTTHMVRSCFPSVRLVANAENLGFAAANNQAIAQSTSRYILLLNPDTILKEKSLTRMLSFMDETPDAGACGPLLLNADTTLQQSCYRFQSPARIAWQLFYLDNLFPLARYPMARWGRSQVQQVDVVKGACLLLRRAVIQTAGSLDEQYYMYSEEADLCYRIAKEGWHTYWVPSAQVVHFGGASTRQVKAEMFAELYRSKVTFQRKVAGGRGSLAVKAVLAAAFIPRWVVASLACPFWPALTVRAKAYRTLLAHLSGM